MSILTPFRIGHAGAFRHHSKRSTADASQYSGNDMAKKQLDSFIIFRLHHWRILQEPYQWRICQRLFAFEYRLGQYMLIFSRCRYLPLRTRCKPLSDSYVANRE